MLNLEGATRNSLGGIQVPSRGLYHLLRDPVMHPAKTQTPQRQESPQCSLTDSSSSAAQCLLPGPPRTGRALPQGTSDDW